VQAFCTCTSCFRVHRGPRKLERICNLVRGAYNLGTIQSLMRRTYILAPSLHSDYPDQQKDRHHNFPRSSLQPSKSTIMDDKNMSDIIEKHVDATDRKIVLSSNVKSKKVFSPMLILALISFQATSVLYGYDDKVIGSVAAMEQFVSLQPNYRKTCDDTRYSSIVATGRKVPRQKR
jgi:hypothetical protein